MRRDLNKFDQISLHLCRHEGKVNQIRNQKDHHFGAMKQRRKKTELPVEYYFVLAFPTLRNNVSFVNDGDVDLIKSENNSSFASSITLGPSYQIAYKSCAIYTTFRQLKFVST